MPAHLIQRIDAGKLYLPFFQRLLECLAACEKRGASYVVTIGYRTPKEQAALYFQGRTLPGKIVTDARPGYSPHQYGIAVDCARLQEQSQVPGHVITRNPDGSIRHILPEAAAKAISWAPEDYDVLADEADKHELQANVPKGYDYGHVQLPLRRKLNTVELHLLGLLKDTGALEDAWKLLDTWGPW